MAIAWFICPYKRRLDHHMPARYCAMDDFTKQLRDAGGDWREVEILGDRAIVKVRGPSAALTSIAATQGFRRLPSNDANKPLSELTQGQRTFLKNLVIDAGYTREEFDEAHPDMNVLTMKHVLRFLARRRLKPRYDEATDEIVLDGIVQQPESVDKLNGIIT